MALISRSVAPVLVFALAASGCQASTPAGAEAGAGDASTSASSSTQGATTNSNDDEKLKDPCRASAKRVGDAIIADCTTRLVVDGSDQGMTDWHFEIKGSQGGTTHLSAEGNFTNEAGQASFIRVVIDDDKYRIEAGEDGSLDVQWANAPDDPDRLVVNQVTPQGIKKSNFATCHGLTDFATQMAKLHVVIEDIDITACDGATVPDPSTGCFPCDAIDPYLTGAKAYTAPGLRGRMHFAQDEALKILKDSGGPNAGIIGAIIGVVAAIVTTVFAAGFRCGPGNNEGTWTTECGWKF